MESGLKRPRDYWIMILPARYYIIEPLVKSRCTGRAVLAYFNYDTDTGTQIETTTFTRFIREHFPNLIV